MSVSEIAQGLVDLCREGKNEEAVARYYSPEIVSIESASGPTMPAEAKGLEAVAQKGKWWMENHQIHSAEVNGPLVGDGQFAVEFNYDVTQKSSGMRLRMNEMALYTVAGDKIVREHFFYNAGG